MDTHLELHARPHPDVTVRRLGFALTHPYVEQCWGAVIGPSGVVLLRRMPMLWSAQDPARIPTAELGASLGVGTKGGDGSRFGRMLHRLARFRLGVWLEPGSSMAIFTEIAPLTERQLHRLPGWTQAAHERLLGDHLDGLAAREGRGTQIADITARLDRFQHSHASLPPSQALGR